MSSDWMIWCRKVYNNRILKDCDLWVLFIVTKVSNNSFIFLGIQRAAQELWPNETQPLFEDPTFENANKFKLSTSQVPINLPLSYMGYGAVVPDGYGISYNLQDSNIIYAICSFFSCQSTNSRRFCEALTTSLRDMKELFIEEWILRDI